MLIEIPQLDCYNKTSNETAYKRDLDIEVHVNPKTGSWRVGLEDIAILCCKEDEGRQKQAWPTCLGCEDLGIMWGSPSCSPEAEEGQAND